MEQTRRIKRASGEYIIRDHTDYHVSKAASDELANVVEKIAIKIAIRANTFAMHGTGKTIKERDIKYAIADICGLPPMETTRKRREKKIKPHGVHENKSWNDPESLYHDDSFLKKLIE